MDKQQRKKKDEKFGWVLKIADFIASIVNAVEKIPNQLPECLCFVLYTVLHFVIAAFHEPWFDEAVAWQIAKNASIKTILFEVPHYEGHPQLWHLVLVPFAKMGAPYELSLALVSYLFSGLSVALILKNGKFPRIVKLLVSFNYFIFYQYSVISRPYCMMMLAFVLLAMCYKRRNEYPGKYILCLVFLCATSAYGIVLAGGIAFCFVIEIFKEKMLSKNLKSLWRDKRCYWLLVLLAFAMFLIISIMPEKDTFAVKLMGSKAGDVKTGTLKRIIFVFLALPSDLMLTSTYNCYTALLKDTIVEWNELLFAAAFGIMIWMLMIRKGKSSRTMSVLIIPYCFFGIFASVVYLGVHHTGIIYLFMVFWIWVSNESEKDNYSSVLKRNMACDLDVEKYIPILRGLKTIFMVVLVMVPVGWSIESAALEVEKVYAPGREEAKFIEEHDLEKYRIWAEWKTLDDDGEMLSLDEVNTNVLFYADNILAYFDNNIFENMKLAKNSSNYSNHKIPTQEENKENYTVWRQEGYPEVLFGEVNLDAVFGEKVDKPYYALVYVNRFSYIWKGECPEYRTHIYMRRDLLEENGVQEIREQWLNENKG